MLNQHIYITAHNTSAPLPVLSPTVVIRDIKTFCWININKPLFTSIDDIPLMGISFSVCTIMTIDPMYSFLLCCQKAFLNVGISLIYRLHIQFKAILYGKNVHANLY